MSRRFGDSALRDRFLGLRSFSASSPARPARSPRPASGHPAAAAARAALESPLRAHEPYPGLVLDRQWNMVLANRSATALTTLLPDFLRRHRLNIFRASLHPQGFAAHTVNFEDWASYLLHALHRSAMSAGDAALAELEREVLGYPNLLSLRARNVREPPAADAFPVP